MKTTTNNLNKIISFHTEELIYNPIISLSRENSYVVPNITCLENKFIELWIRNKNFFIKSKHVTDSNYLEYFSDGEEPFSIVFFACLINYRVIPSQTIKLFLKKYSCDNGKSFYQCMSPFYEKESYFHNEMSALFR